MDGKFLKDVQDKGWHIEAVTDDTVIAKCPSVACGLRAQLRQGSAIPAVDPGSNRGILDRKVATYDDIRMILKDRREGLSLTIHNVETICGLSEYHIAKMEKENYSRQPTAQTLIDWALALGLELVLRPVELTPYAVRIICETRDKVDARSKRFTVERRRRGS